MTKHNVHIDCSICGVKKLLDQHYQLKVQICDECANRVANLYWYERTGRFLTWPDPNRRAKPPTKGFSATRKLEVWKRDGFKCVDCKSDSDLTVDHIHPRSKGGTEEMDNLQTLCRPCNSRKCAKVRAAA